MSDVVAGHWQPMAGNKRKCAVLCTSLDPLSVPLALAVPDSATIVSSNDNESDSSTEIHQLVALRARLDESQAEVSGQVTGRE
jgi:hypothetical protein